MAAEPREVANWREVLEGSDQDTFREIVEPLIPTLMRAARRDLDFYVNQGSIQSDDFSSEELVGEAILYAWQHRSVRPEKMGLRSWLLSTLHRTTRGLVNRQRGYRHSKSLSLDEPVPTDPDAQDTQEWFWDWYQPDSMLTWEDVIPSQQPDDIEVPLGGDYEELIEDSEARHVLMLHDEFEMSLPEVAFTINRTPAEVGEMLEMARATLREREATPDPGMNEPRRDPRE